MRDATACDPDDEARSSPQPKPFDPSVLRNAPDRLFPPYRHLPGDTPHPRKHPRGHSHGIPDLCESPPLTATNWGTNAAYLYGVDLFNYAYWWEAHEQWEGLWLQTNEQPKEGDLSRDYLQGLIQASASLLKWHQGYAEGMRRLEVRARSRLHRVASTIPVYMGLDAGEFLRRLARLLAGGTRAESATAMPSEGPVIRLRPHVE